MRLTRRKLLAGGAGAALAAAGIYELVDQLGGSPSRPAAGRLPPEQHLLDGVRIVEDNGVEVVVPPLHHQLVTAGEGDRREEGAGELEHILQKLEKDFDQPRGARRSPSPGACHSSASYVLKLADAHIPVDLRATRTPKKPVKVLLDSRRFQRSARDDPRGERRRGAPP